MRVLQVQQGSATKLPYPDNFFDAVLTDPPYYDNVPYSDLSDFFYCLLPGTWVLTESGYKPIEEICVGERVLSHKGRWTPVRRIFRRFYQGKIFLIHVAYCSQPLKITPGHKVLVRRRGEIEPIWVPSEELREGDFMFLPTPRPASAYARELNLMELLPGHPSDGKWLYYGSVSGETLRIHQALAELESIKPGVLRQLATNLQVRYDKVRRLRSTGAPTRLCIPNCIKIDQNLTTLVGYYLAEGSVTLRPAGRHVITFVFGDDEQSFVQEVERLMNLVFGVRGKLTHVESEKAVKLAFYCKPIAELFAQTFGRYSRTRSLPTWFWDLPNDLLVGLVRGYWNGDGSKGDEFYQLTTTSAALAGQIRTILQRLGVIAHVYYDSKERATTWEGKLIRSSPRFLLKVWGKYRARLAEILGISTLVKPGGQYLSRMKEEGLWIPVRRIITGDYDGLVYNLETDDHSYTTMQGCVHNCWLKRTVGDLYPELFATPLTPKSEEIVQDPNRQNGHEAARAFFEQRLTQAFREIHRVLKPDGIAGIVFAHKTTEAWETVINALLEAGLYMTASWPIHTEMQARLNAQETASLASSIYMVCRKRTTSEVGEYPKVRREIEERVRQKLTQFWDEGIRGADFFMSAIGPAVEAFGKYARVEKLSGERVSVAELLEYVRKVVAEFALERVLGSAQLGGVDAPTRFYLLYRWTYNHSRVPFDEARKLAQGLGLELTALWGEGGLIEKHKDYISVPTPLDRARSEKFTDETTFATIIDALHYALWLWERNAQKRLQEHLAATYGGSETFWQVAQAIAEVLPEGDKEKQLLQGLLYGRKSFQKDTQQRLDLFNGGES
jgi:intein/homing endonuclease